MSKDLMLHNNSSFMKLGEISTNQKNIIAQAFSFLLMTRKGSIPLETEIGTDLALGKTNLTSMSLQVQKAVDAVYTLMKAAYKLTDVEILSLEETKDGIELSVKIKSADSSDILNFIV